MAVESVHEASAVCNLFPFEYIINIYAKYPFAEKDHKAHKVLHKGHKISCELCGKTYIYGL
jgi:hypothetical protein